MTKEELKQEAEQDAGNVSGLSLSTTIMVSKDKTDAYRLGRFDGYLSGAEPREKRISELEEKISVLLSCKNCPENKGGFICVKEYENKCLAQKIQYIKELKTDYEVLSCSVGDFEELQNKLEEEQRKNNGLSDNLTKAKELLNEFMRISKASDEDFEHDYSELIAEAEQFLKDCEVEK